MGLWTTSRPRYRVRVELRDTAMYTPHGRIITRLLFTSNNFTTSAALAEMRSIECQSIYYLQLMLTDVA